LTVSLVCPDAFPDPQKDNTLLPKKITKVLPKKIHTKERKKSLKEIAFIKPEWLNETAWNAFMEMRVKIRKPLTEYAKTLIVNKLLKFQEQGYDPIEVLNKATESSWQGIFTTGLTPKANEPEFTLQAKIREAERERMAGDGQ